VPEVRVGQGFDIHPFSNDPARRLVLGGVGIPGARGLDGHSDADVVAHALADAVLGAAALGDLGSHFPDSDPAYAGADSIELLARVVELARGVELIPVNGDCTVVAEAPRLGPYVPEMVAALGRVLRAPVSVKATRGEGLGAIGRAEGVACLAVVLLAAPGHGA
jgi:2-C-methyl-D-erythritol 2,4-cyclodiphosphate synthase